MMIMLFILYTNEPSKTGFDFPTGASVEEIGSPKPPSAPISTHPSFEQLAQDSAFVTCPPFKKSRPEEKK